MNAKKFPFDTQNCSIRIGSWQHDEDRIKLESDVNNDSLKDFIYNPIWELKAINDSEFESKFRFLGQDLGNSDVVFYFILKRRSAYYIINNIYPCLILNIVSLLSFRLPFASQVTLSKYSTKFLI